MYRYLCWYLSLQISMKYLETSYFAAVKYLEISHFATTTWVFRQYQVGDIFQIYCRFWKILTYIHIDICSNEIFRNILLCNIHMGRPSTPLICTYPPLGPYSHQNWKSCLNQIKKWPSGGRWYAPKCSTPGVSAWGHRSKRLLV